MKPSDPATADRQTGCTRPEPATLSPREREIVRQIAEGKTSKEIAVQLGISLKTVETHRTNMYRKCHFRSLADVVRYAIREGLVEP